MKDIEGIFVSIKKAQEHQLSLQADEGYWWYTLEANESICAEAIFLMHFLGEVDEGTQGGLVRRILSSQRRDGTWSLYYNGPPDLSTTIECYWALKLVAASGFTLHPEGEDRSHPRGVRWEIASALNRARDFIISKGGITRARVFTKIHLAQFGLVPWDACPAMPVELILMPSWSPVNVYEFSSWARACIIPLLVVLQKKPVRKFQIPVLHPEGEDRSHPRGVRMGGFNLDELFAEDEDKRNWNYHTDKAFLSWERFFISLNKVLKIAIKFPFCPFDGPALKRCEEWICEHIEKTEDIYPALAYGAIALSSLGHSNEHPMIKKALKALKSFQQYYEGDELPPLPNPPPRGGREREGVTRTIYQQCCISPVWDTPWQMTALLDAGVSPDHPRLLKAARWLISKQITTTRGDWKIKNPDGVSGGWSFEFENEFFPDIDDAIQVLHILNRIALPEEEKREPIRLGLEWVLSMQNDDGGWGAFDKNQRLEVVNKIPFSDHGACLDPSSPDVAGRMLALLAQLSSSPPPSTIPSSPCGRRLGGGGECDRTKAILKAINYLKKTQLESGAWSGRWGVNLIYGTWCALTGLAAFFPSPLEGEGQGEGELKYIKKAVNWLKSIQHKDGGFSESPETYRDNIYTPYPRLESFNSLILSQSKSLILSQSKDETVRASSFDKAHDELSTSGVGVPSQTAWGLMGLVAGGEAKSPEAIAAARFLSNSLQNNGEWIEKEFTGTGFPLHFYIRYHGYRHFFPLLALAKFANR